jgi:hypothetical protein
LLRRASVQQNFDPLSQVSFVFLSFKGQKNPGGEAEAFGHAHNSIETRNFFPSFNVAPKIGRYVSSFRRLLKTELSVLSKLANAFGELGAMFQGVRAHTIASKRTPLHNR